MHRHHAVPLALALAASFPAVAGGPVDAPLVAPGAAAADAATDRFIVRFREPAGDVRTKLAVVSGQSGEKLTLVRAMSGGAHVVRLGRRVDGGEARRLANALAADATFESVEPDLLLQPLATPNDTNYGQQWHYATSAGGIGAPPAWDTTTGASGVKVAVIDTGVVPHADLAGRLLSGYDFVLGRAGGSDPGDHGCNGSASSWHGTHVAGTIGAATNNGNGVAGINWVGQLLPLRVLGRCGGYTSDIADAMRWGAGLAVPGLPANPDPVRVENLSLGGTTSCGTTMQRAIDDVTARGTVVVVAAGNGNVDAAGTQPANCNGVVVVGATLRDGGRASYSNFGSKLTLSAPGGGNGNGVLSTLNTGTTTPVADSYAYYQGTSMATPHVAGVVSLMLSVDASLTPARVLQLLRQTARPFPTGTGADCSPAVCGAGIVDATAAVAAVAANMGSAWTTIASEGQSFNAGGTQTVRYGSGSSWVTKSVTGDGTCSNAWFGFDPLVGTPKLCQIAGAGQATAWSGIAGENQSFSVVGTQTVRYGSGSNWVAKSVTNGGVCSNAFFGADPIVGTLKQCQVVSPPASSWLRIAGEGQSFGVDGSRTVRYGSGTSWVARSVTSTGSCSNDFFGSDPIFGTPKVCELAQ